jgi:hypothetical protein
MKKLLFLSLAVLILSCDKTETETPKAALVIPTSYESTNYTANTVAELALRNSLVNLATEMKKAEKGTKLSSEAINAIFTSGTPSLKSITAPSFNTKLEGSTGYITELVNSSGTTYLPSTPNTTGGVYGARLLNPGGLETLQMIDKGLYGAAFYNYALSLISGTITEKTIDQLVAIYGASLAFPNTNTASKTTSPDGFAALYAARRDKNDGSGIYTKTKNAFVKAQAAVKAGSQYNTERDEAINVIKQEWEKALMATVIHYNYAAITKLSTTNPAETVLSGALHDLGEGVGFLDGFKAVPQSQRKITDAQLNELDKILRLDNAGKTEMYKYITDPVASITKLQTAFAKLQTIYSFTNSEMEDFKKNWISEQGR